MNARRRGSILVAVGIASALAFAGVACATSEAAVGIVTDDGGNTLTGDAGVEDDDASLEDAAPDTLSPPRECSDQNFCHTKVPEGATLTSVWGDGAGVVWSVSAQGTIYRWDGAQWIAHQETAPDGDTGIYTVWGSGPTDVWVAGALGLFHGTGATAATLSFAPVTGLPGNPDVPLSSVWGSGPNDVWTVGYRQDPNTGALSGRVLHYTGASGGWSEVSISVPREYEWSPDPTVAPLGVFGSGASGTWVHGAWINDLGNAVAVLFRIAPGSSEGVRMKIPEGNAYPPGLEPFTGVGVMDDGTVWLGVVSKVGRHSYIRGKAPYAERDWESLYRAQYESDPHFFWGPSANDAWQVGDFGRLRHWDGTTWTQSIIMVTSAPVKSDFFGAWAANKDEFWVVGDGIALHKKP